MPHLIYWVSTAGTVLTVGYAKQKGMNKMHLKNYLTRAALTTAMDYISGDPEKNLPKLLGFIESIGWGKNQTEVFHRILDDPNSNWYQFLMGLWQDIDNDVLKAIFRNFALNATLFGYAEQEKNAEKYDCNIP